jgi:hypothetical protein
MGGVVGLFLPNENVLPADFKLNFDLGIGGMGMLLKGFSCGDFHSSWWRSIDDGAVDAALNREELSVVEAVFVFDAPLPL